MDTTNIEVNKHFKHYTSIYPKQSPKIYADVYIDDKGVGVKEIDWFRIRKLFKDVKWEQ